MQRIQRQLPSVLCLQRGLDRAKCGTVRAHGTGLGNHRLFSFLRHKTAILANPETSWDDTAEISVALALVSLHLRHPFTDAVPLGLGHR